MKITFSYLVSTFFTSHLGNELGLSRNTISSYSDCMKLLINYTCRRLRVEPEAIDIHVISPELVFDFLNFVEKDRGNGAVTRNQRLASIKTFFHFLARTVPELMHQNERIQALKPKRTDHRPPPSLMIEEVVALLSAPDQETILGARDKALIQLLYNTGARVQELANLIINDVRFIAPATVKLTGKGQKTRIVPLWEQTVDILTYYLSCRKKAGINSEILFINANGSPLTRFGIGKRITLHAETAAKNCPSLRNRVITPHTFRHTTALHLIESGNDITIVKEWLGHAHIKTTSQYLEVSVERKRKALEKMPPPDGGLPTESPQWTQSDIMEFLSKCSGAHVMLRKRPPKTKKGLVI